MDQNQCTNCGADNSTRAKYCTSCGHALPNYQPEIIIEEPVAPPKKKLTTAQWLGIVAGIIFFIVSSRLAQEYLIKRPMYDKAMMEFASQINESCPIMVDNATRLDNAVVLPGRLMQYNYTLVGMNKDSTNIEDIREKLRPQIVNLVKTNPEMKSFRDMHVSLNYVYKDMFGVYMFTIEVKPKDYKE